MGVSQDSQHILEGPDDEPEVVIVEQVDKTLPATPTDVETAEEELGQFIQGMIS